MKKTNFIWILAVFLLAVPMAFAAAPIFQSLSPANNSVFLEDNVTLNVTATDGDNPINYTFWVEPGIYFTNNDTYSGVLQTPGTSFANPNYMTAACNPCDSDTKKDIIINQDTLMLWAGAWSNDRSDTQAWIQIDNVEVFDLDPLGDSVWKFWFAELDVSAWNDGEAHEFAIHYHGDVGHTLKTKWWFPSYTNVTAPSNSDNFKPFNQTFNESNNTYFLTSNYSDAGGSGYHYLDVRRWWATAYNNNSESTESEHRDLAFGELYNCTDSDAAIALNFTIRDVENETPIISTMETDLLITIGDQEFAFNTELTDDSNYNICLSPGYAEVTLNQFVNYLPDNVDYSYIRYYYFIDNVISATNKQDINLYALEDSLSEVVTFTMQKQGQNVAGGLIQILRYDLATGTSKIVAMKETNPSGIATERLRVGDAQYKIAAYDENNVLCYADSVPRELTASVNIYCDVSGVSSDYWPLWLLYHYVDYSITYNNVTNTSTLTWAGISGAPTQACYRITKLTGAAENITNSSCVSSATGSISFVITDQDATYNQEFIAYLTYGDTTNWFILASEFLELKSDLSDLIGKDGTFLAIFIIGLLAFTGLFNPAAAVLLATLGVVITSLMGLIPLGLGALVAIVLTGGIIAVKMRT